MTLHIDIHIVQSVPPSNINRDDTGSPKTAIYGGVRRARVSSQAWKRATRRDFSDYLDTSELGVRTKRAVTLLAERIVALAPEIDPDSATDRAIAALEAAKFKVKAGRKAKDGEQPLTEYLMFFSNVQLDRLAELAAAAEDGKVSARDAKAALDQDHSVDVSLFGRMVANDADLNVDAACQVAHSLSTHAVATEFDYYTAVDDKNPDEETGAGMIGTIEFDSATLYRYATINVGTLKENLGDPTATARAVEAFVRSFVTSMPTGKQNTFANRTVPDAVVVLARPDRPVNLVGAFEDAVRGKGGFVAASCAALASHANDVDSAFGSLPTDTWVTRVGARTDALNWFGEPIRFDDLVTAVGQRVLSEVTEES
jgi:CRISPR system Cascade subunit CasC